MIQSRFSWKPIKRQPAVIDKPHIAVVEDEHSLRKDLAEYLQARGFAVQDYASAEALYQAFAPPSCDLVLLDIGLPGQSGLQAARWVRDRSSAGIVMLTAFREPADQVAGLQAGADAYLIKNAPLEVIEATCRSVLRRVAANRQLGIDAQVQHTHSARAHTPAVEESAWQLQPKRWLLIPPKGEPVVLTYKELIFLSELMQAQGRTVSRLALLKAMGKTETLSNLRNLENYASRLRRKVLSQTGLELPVRTSYSQGYTFAAPMGLKEEEV